MQGIGIQQGKGLTFVEMFVEKIAEPFVLFDRKNFGPGPKQKSC